MGVSHRAVGTIEGADVIVTGRAVVSSDEDIRIHLLQAKRRGAILHRQPQLARAWPCQIAFKVRHRDLGAAHSLVGSWCGATHYLRLSHNVALC